MIARIHNKRLAQILLSYLYTLIKPFIPKVFSIIRPSCFERKMWEMRVILQCAPPQWIEILSEGACFYRPNLDHSIQQFKILRQNKALKRLLNRLDITMQPLIQHISSQIIDSYLHFPQRFSDFSC